MIPEPTDALGLWSQVKAFSGWPTTNETSVLNLADAWTQAGQHFTEPAGLTAETAVRAWPDGSGGTFAASAQSAIDKAAVVVGDAAVLAQAARGYADLVIGVKQGLTSLIDLNLPAYAALRLLPPVVRGPVEAAFVSMLGNFAAGLMADATTRAAALGSVKLAAATASTAPADDPLAGIPPAPPPGTDPAAVKRWWDSIPPELRDQYIAQHPEQLGGLDGIPAAVRDQANRLQLDRQRAALEAQLRDLEAHPPIDLDNYASWHFERDALQGKLRGITAIQDALNSTPTKSRDEDGFFLLGLDSTGGGHFIVARGNPDTAANVATFVPGSLTNLSQAPTLLAQGDAIHRSALRAAPTASVITWLDYDSPPTIPAAVPMDLAEAAAPRLAQFQEGLRATHLGAASHNTVVGHSYGSTVAGLANTGSRPMPVDDIIAAGSPGMGVDQADQLAVGRDHVWVIESPHDAIADAGTAGTDPSQDRFGARVYNSEPGPPVGSESPSRGGYSPYAPQTRLPHYDYNSAAHDSYFREPDNAGLDRLGDIIAGQEPRPR